MDGLDRGTIEVDRGSDSLFVGLLSAANDGGKGGFRSVFDPSKDGIWTQITDIGGEFSDARHL